MFVSSLKNKRYFTEIYFTCMKYSLVWSYAKLTTVTKIIYCGILQSRIAIGLFNGYGWPQSVLLAYLSCLIAMNLDAQKSRLVYRSFERIYNHSYFIKARRALNNLAIIWVLQLLKNYWYHCDTQNCNRFSQSRVHFRVLSSYLLHMLRDNWSDDFGVEYFFITLHTNTLPASVMQSE